MVFASNRKLVYYCLATSVVCLEVVRWLGKCSVLATCQEKRKALNRFCSSSKNHLLIALKPASFIHLAQSFLTSKFPGGMDLQVYQLQL